MVPFSHASSLTCQHIAVLLAVAISLSPMAFLCWRMVPVAKLYRSPFISGHAFRSGPSTNDNEISRQSSSCTVPYTQREMKLQFRFSYSRPEQYFVSARFLFKAFEFIDAPMFGDFWVLKENAQKSPLARPRKLLFRRIFANYSQTPRNDTEAAALAVQYVRIRVCCKAISHDPVRSAS